ncbi:hypothetical protein [Desertibacillus haloalkaliphilus]|uniref:hypothetical protein n=1 Tax=Desertibacillus haloalkaliphilus TaxID=1328930 RepID=UPI001C27EC89|nr:hypothetical protein [Desertibacillus haloalkaliphilus]MBU8908548.1 hypothetical protein [Desertibacillus haloalkaliphilus]
MEGFYVLDKDKPLVARLHNFIVEQRALAVHHTVKKDYRAAELCEKEAKKAIDEIKDLEADRVHHERNVRNLKRMAELVGKSGSPVTLIIEGRKVT